MSESGVSDLPAPGELVIESRIEDERVVLSLRGELDLTSVPAFERELQGSESTPRPWLLIDMSGLEFMDSTGLRALLQARERAHSKGRRLTLRRGSRQVQRVLELTKTLDAFEFED